MMLKYGNYTFTANAAGVTHEIRALWNQGGQNYANEETIRVEAFIYGADQYAITLAVSALETALAIQNRPLVLLHDNGTQSATFLTPQGSITGVRSKVIGYPRYHGPEYVNQRFVTCEFSAEYPLPGTGALLLDFHESLTQSGGGPVFKMRPNLNTFASRWLVYPQYPATLIQEGFAVGYQGYPPPPPPVFPNALMEPGQIKRDSPKLRGQGYDSYRVDWRYVMQDVVQGAAVPNVWR